MKNIRFPSAPLLLVPQLSFIFFIFVIRFSPSLSLSQLSTRLGLWRIQRRAAVTSSYTLVPATMLPGCSQQKTNKHQSAGYFIVTAWNQCINSLKLRLPLNVEVLHVTKRFCSSSNRCLTALTAKFKSNPNLNTSILLILGGNYHCSALQCKIQGYEIF